MRWVAWFQMVVGLATAGALTVLWRHPPDEKPTPDGEPTVIDCATTLTGGRP